MDIEVTYHLPVSDELRDARALPGVAHAVQELHGSLVEDDDVARVDSTLAFTPGGAARVQSITATRIWSIDEALYDSDLLALTCEELCAELHAMLELLYAHFGPTDEGAPPGDLASSDRRYLKPPTA
jgi:hypothetical protein